MLLSDISADTDKDKDNGEENEYLTMHHGVQHMDGYVKEGMNERIKSLILVVVLGMDVLHSAMETDKNEMKM